MSQTDRIFDKIETIRKQPEYIRLRWAWGLTFASMILVFIIWMLSIASMKTPYKNNEVLNGQQEFFNEFESQKESLENASGEIKNLIDKSNSLQDQDKESETTPENSKNLENEGFTEQK